ncbi:stage V sporulation protein AE [Risungbinella massiliensis]|uniref:stage V sporulation protein AE n=1 Tax=Risungbinella massiliensis TaxID=1329796 RepID=UPI0005CC8071|nr:stage V sporulation protein AE [Risungbinella massiliensis]
MKKRQVILITDGDQVAQQAIEIAAKKVGGRCISRSAGNPTLLSGEEIVQLVLSADHDPVLVMFDDCGANYEGKGEQALRYVASHSFIDVIGAIAVASNSRSKHGTPVHMALDWNGNIISDGVGKEGCPKHTDHLRIFGDTVEILNEVQVPIIVGIGDIGKMQEHDMAEMGAPVTTKAVKLILQMNRQHRNAAKQERRDK